MLSKIIVSNVFAAFCSLLGYGGLIVALVYSGVVGSKLIAFGGWTSCGLGILGLYVSHYCEINVRHKKYLALDGS